MPVEASDGRQGRATARPRTHRTIRRGVHAGCSFAKTAANLPHGPYSASTCLTYTFPDSIGDSTMCNSLTNLRGPATSRFGLITHHLGEESAEEVLHTEADRS